MTPPKASSGRIVLMVGTSPHTKGGVASVIRTYETAGLFSKWPVCYRATHVDGTPIRKLFTALSAWFWCVGFLFRRRDVLLHVHAASRASFWRKTAFILPAVWSGIPVIFHLHGGGFMRFYQEECGPLRKRLIRYVLDRCTRIIVLSRSWEQSLATITRNRATEVIANPVMPSAVPHIPEGSSSLILLFVGRLVRGKGIYVLLESLSAVVQQYPDVRLICAGDGELDEVHQVAVELGLGDRVEFTGWVDDVRRAELLSIASIYVLPSFAEGLPMSVLEAMSAGLAIVTTPVGGIPEAIIDGREGILVPVGDVTGLSEALCRLLSDHKLRAALAARARAKFDACFNAGVVLPQIEALYSELGVMPRGED